MKSNILLVGLDYEYIKEVAIELANQFDMFFLDVNKLIEYSLIDPEKVKLKCGIEYFEKEEKKIALGVNDYENSIICFPYSLFKKNNYNIELSDNCITIHIYLNKNHLETLNSKKDDNNKLVIELLTCEELNKILKKITEISVEVKSLEIEKCVEEIIYKLKQNLAYLENLT